MWTSHGNAYLASVFARLRPPTVPVVGKYGANATTKASYPTSQRTTPGIGQTLLQEMRPQGRAPEEQEVHRRGIATEKARARGNSQPKESLSLHLVIYCLRLLQPHGCRTLGQENQQCQLRVPTLWNPSFWLLSNAVIQMSPKCRAKSRPWSRNHRVW